jgi:hypothetical protein
VGYAEILTISCLFPPSAELHLAKPCGTWFCEGVTEANMLRLRVRFCRNRADAERFKDGGCPRHISDDTFFRVSAWLFILFYSFFIYFRV